MRSLIRYVALIAVAAACAVLIGSTLNAGIKEAKFGPARILWGSKRYDLSAVCIQGAEFVVAQSGNNIDIEPLVGPEGRPRRCEL